MCHKSLILLVDDVPENLQILYQILNTGDYSFALASGGTEALNLVEKKKPDLILLDIMMNDMNGYQVCEKLKADANTSDIPIIFLTAKTELEDKVKGFELGAVDYITKPFEDAEVVARVRNHIRLKTTIDLIKEHVNELTINMGDMLASYNEFTQTHISPEKSDNINTFKAMTKEATHEINQPLTVLQGYMDLLRNTIDPNILTSSQMKYLDCMGRSLAKLIIIVDNFRKYSSAIDI